MNSISTTAVSFNLQTHLDNLYSRRNPGGVINAKTLTELVGWQNSMLHHLSVKLGLSYKFPPYPLSPSSDKINVVQKQGYREEKHALFIDEGVAIPVYLLVPDGPDPFKPVLVFPGHNTSVQWILGNYPNEQEAKTWLALDGNYAQALAQAGFLVCAVEQRGFGERVTNDTYSGATVPRSCQPLAREYAMLGRTLIGERCWDGINVISWLASRSDVNIRTLGCTGNSGGGTTALYLSALDKRITTAVPACCFSTFKGSILKRGSDNQGHGQCECNYVPGILSWFEMGEIAAMIAPRPLCLIAGKDDHHFPLNGAKEEFKKVEQAYKLLGASEKCSLAIHDGGHAFNHQLCHEWFKRWL